MNDTIEQKILYRIAYSAILFVFLFGGLILLSERAMAGSKTESNSLAASKAQSASLALSKATGGEANAYGGDAKAFGGSAVVSDLTTAASAGVNHSGNGTANNSLTLNEATPENDITIRSAPGLSVGSIFPANPCHMPWNAGLSIIGGAGSLGNTKVDPVCQQLEWTRVAFQMGLRDAALHSLCEMEQARGNPHCITENEWQDYNMEVGALEDQVRVISQQYEDAQTRGDQLARENILLKEEVERRRLAEQVSK